ncbi:hypothetical protein, partial [Pseudonocardia hydrocarbonoxydans]|uniref:hypothetical protein n=1 Tax=Pseudonocardia hydrocarbonoxydans TaxID=76726 RepID=UPI0031DBCC10
WPLRRRSSRLVAATPGRVRARPLPASGRRPAPARPRGPGRRPRPGAAARPRRPRAVLAGAIVLGALAHVLVLETVSFDTALVFWTLSGTLFGTLTAGALRPRRWGSGRTTTLVVVALPVVFVTAVLVALGLSLAGSGTAIVVVTLGVYALWALTLWRRRTRA